MKISAVLALFVGSLSAQQPYSERINVSVVNVDVAVSEADGTPVRSLTREDFVLFEDGLPQTITNFYTVDGTNAVAPNPTAGSPASADERFRRKVLVLVDVFHTTKNRRALALANLERLIDNSFRTGEYDWSVAVMGRGVTIVLPLTSDKKAIHDTFERLIKAGERREPGVAVDLGRPSEMPNPNPDKNYTPPMEIAGDPRLDRAMSFDEQDRILRAKFTTQAVIDAVRGFASTSGKKIVLLLTGDMGLNDLEMTGDNFGSRGGAFFQRPLTPDLARRGRDIADLRTSIVQEANVSGVSIYIFNTEGLQPAGELGAIPAPVTNTAAVFWLASDTGGRLVTGNDGAAALRQFDTASSNYYSLGYRPPHPEDGRYHRIEVRMKSLKGVRLEYRSGYSSSPTEAQLARAMQSPVSAAMLPTALPVKLTTGTPQAERRGILVPISVKVPFSSLQFLPEQDGTAAHVQIRLSVFDDVGKNLFSGEFPLTTYKNAVVLSKGATSQLVAAVRDETTDSIGVASAVVKY